MLTGELFERLSMQENSIVIKYSLVALTPVTQGSQRVYFVQSQVGKSQKDHDCRRHNDVYQEEDEGVLTACLENGQLTCVLVKPEIP